MNNIVILFIILAIISGYGLVEGWGSAGGTLTQLSTNRPYYHNGPYGYKSYTYPYYYGYKNMSGWYGRPYRVGYHGYPHKGRYNNRFGYPSMYGWWY